MVVAFNAVFGMVFGIIIMDNEDKEYMGINWGFILMLGPIALQIMSPKKEDE